MSNTITPIVFYRTLDVDGLEIFYREADPRDAPTVLLLHGFPSSSHMFRNLIPMLADKNHVVVPDFPGYGESSAKGYLNGDITNDDAALERAKAFITSGLASGQLKPVIARTFSLEQIQEATRFLESNAQIGKVVVNV